MTDSLYLLYLQHRADGKNSTQTKMHGELETNVSKEADTEPHTIENGTAPKQPPDDDNIYPSLPRIICLGLAIGMAMLLVW